MDILTKRKYTHREVSGVNPWRRLAIEIVIRAVEDYRAALTRQRIQPGTASELVEDCEQFFLSEWFYALTETDGSIIMDRIRREVNESFANTGNA